MPAVTVRNIPGDLYQALKQAARAHHRSLNGEIVACLETARVRLQSDPDATLARIDAQRNALPAMKPLSDALLDDARAQGRA